MISAIRKNFRRGGIQVVVFITIASMLGADFLRRKMGKSQDLTTAATVNGYELPMKVFKARVREEERIINFFRSQFGENADMILRSQGLGVNPQENVMKNMVRDSLLDGAADKIGIELSSSYISKKLTDPQTVYSILNKLFPTLGINQSMRIDPLQLSSFLKKEGLTVSEFEEILENEVKRSAIMDIVAGAAYVPNFVIEEKFAIKNKDRKFAILELKLEDYVNKLKATGIFDKQAKEYFETQNKKSKKYWAPEKRSATVWVIKPESYGLVVSEKEIKDYLVSNKNSKIDNNGAKKALLNQKFKRLFEIDARRITSGSGTTSEQFNEFIKNKKATESKLVDIQSDSTLKSRAVFSIKPDQKMHYIDEDGGYIVQLNKVMPSHQNEFDKIKPTVLTDLYTEKARELFIKDLEKYNNELNSKKLEDVAKEYQLALGAPARAIEKTDWLNGKTAEKYQGFEKRKIDPAAVLQMTHKGNHMVYPTEDAGYLIYVLDAKPLDNTLFENTKADFIDAANQEALQQITYSFIASLNKNAKINYNTSFDSAT